MLLTKKKGFIFDFDGVICDSEKYHYSAWKEVAVTLGVTFTPKDYEPFQSTGRRAVISELCRRAAVPFEEDRFAALSAVKSRAFARAIEHVDKQDLIAGVERFILALYERGASLAVASGARTAGEMLTTVGLSPYFSVVVDGKDGLSPKPDPAVFLKACEKLGLTPEDCYVFEDSPAGVKAGLSGGFSVIGIGPCARNFPLPVFYDFYQVYEAFFGA